MVAALALAAAHEFRNERKRLAGERDEINSEWLQVASAMEVRAGLLPGLAELIESEADGEAGIFRSLANAQKEFLRARTPPEKIAANLRLSHALSKVLVITENYPRLRSSKKLLRSEEEIGNSENRIAVERRKYNEMLEHYNSSLQMFPGNIVAALAGFARNEAYFQTDPEARPVGRE